MVYKVKWDKSKEVEKYKYDFKKNPLNKLKLKKQRIVLVDSDKWTWEIPINKTVT